MLSDASIQWTDKHVLAIVCRIPSCRNSHFLVISYLISTAITALSISPSLFFDYIPLLHHLFIYLIFVVCSFLTKLRESLLDSFIKPGKLEKWRQWRNFSVHPPNDIALRLGQRRRRRAYVNPALFKRLVFAVYFAAPALTQHRVNISSSHWYTPEARQFMSVLDCIPHKSA